MEEFIFIKESSFIRTIVEKRRENLGWVSSTIGKEYGSVNEYVTLEEITNFFMKKMKKSDLGFKLWLFAVGEHICETYGAEWYLRERQSLQGKYLDPLLLDKNGRIWELGVFCYALYYNKRRMAGIGFEFFYKVYVEQRISKLKFKDYQIDKNQLFKL